MAREDNPRPHPRTVIDHITTMLRLNTADMRVLSGTSNAVFDLPKAGVVVRVPHSHLPGRANNLVTVANWFARANGPTIRLASRIAAQPITVAGLQATVWIRVPPLEPAPTANDLGPALRQFHAIEVPTSIEVPQWNPVGDARKKLASADGLAPQDHRYLHEWCDNVESQLAALNGLPTTWIHNDAHDRNLLRTPEGLRWCDFDTTCVGPSGVDLATAAVASERFGRRDAYRQLVATYGQDITETDAWPVLREARELKLVVGAVHRLAQRPEFIPQFQLRLKTIKNNDRTTRWTPYI